MRFFANLLLFLILLASAAFAQEHGAPAAETHPAAPAAEAQQDLQHQKTDPHSVTPTPNAQTDQTQVDAEHAADGHAEHAQEGEHGGHGKFLYSPTVRSWGAKLGLSPIAARWVFFGINFLVLVAIVWWIAKKMNVRAMLAARTEAIRKGMDDARKASEEANRRLSDIESRLARLDTEIAAMRTQAESDSAAEEERIRVAAEEDRRKIVAAAEAEIDAAAKSARRDLKAYTADLAVQLAAKRINIDSQTDEALVRNFVGQLNDGKDGR